MDYVLRCSTCGKEYEDFNATILACEECRSDLEVVYDYNRILQSTNKEVLKRRQPGVWKYEEVLPLRDNAKIVTLGEGGTKLHKCRKLGRILGMKNLYAKDETKNPTGTFKDRSATVGVSKALELGVEGVGIASDGNAGPATAAYSAKAGLRCYVFMPTSTPIERIIQVHIFGAKVITVEGTVNECIDFLAEVQNEHNLHPLTTARLVNPYQAEGPKTISFEICEDLDWKVPDWVVIPIGGGGLLTASWKGFKELFDLGLIEKLPKIAGVQAEGCAPVVKAYNDNLDKIGDWTDPKTVALTIGVPNPPDGATALRAIKESEGVAVAVSDEEILMAEKQLAENEGIFSEPAGVTSLAGVKKLVEEGKIAEGETVVFEVTGTGLKDIKSAMSICDVKPPAVKADPEGLKMAIRFLNKWESI